MSLFFPQSSSSDTYGALFDIGSGSVLVAIVHSNVKNSHPSILWSHREHVPLRDIDSLEQASKSVMTALINAAMELDTTGRNVLTQHNSKARISQIQSSISAPWSHTITKTINYTQEKPFTITQTLIAELIKTTEQKIQSDLKQNEALKGLGLQSITAVTMDTLANGYHIKNPKDGSALEFSISRANVVAQGPIINAMNETSEKLFADIDHKQLSFMLMAFSVMRDLLPQKYEITIVDITYEATELGIVRDGSLQYCTHTPFGSFSLAREIAAALSVPLSEAFGYLHTQEPLTFLDHVSDAQKGEVDEIFEAYIEKITSLFKETGDELSIPKTIALHVDLNSEPLFLNLIEKAAKRCTKSTPVITLVTTEILNQTFDKKTTKTFFAHSSDTALLLSALFFHKHHNSTTFTNV
jgi:cell division ATPase FtsA